MGRLEVLLVGGGTGHLQVVGRLAHLYLVGDQLADVLGDPVYVLPDVLLHLLPVLCKLLQLAGVL